MYGGITPLLLATQAEHNHHLSMYLFLLSPNCQAELHPRMDTKSSKP